jgi:16S rRNA (cytidine1402-2'-O)-methyltransferase
VSSARRPAGTLYLVATPIGNLEDVTLRALRVLGETAFVACEDTRTTRKLLARHGIEARLVSCHEHNEALRAREIAEALARGEDVALATDAGTPAVSDPGRRVVEAALAAGAKVVPVPGPSAVTAALVASGLAAERFTFLGFPPRKGRARAELLREALETKGAAVLFEAPHRVARTLAELAALAPERRASLHREMTKVHEEALRGTLTELQRALAEKPVRGEYTLVVAGTEPKPKQGSLARAVAEGRRLVAAGRTPRDAAREAAGREGVSRRLVYRRLVRGGEEEE